jgi:rhamnosyltransferase
MTDPVATVAVLTYNGEAYLDRLLTAVETQVFDGEIELLVIDSGSTDRTLEIIAGHPGLVLHQIPNEEFGHGKTRDLAVRISHGRHIAFLTQDAIPMTEHWLTELLAPFDIDDRIAIVTGRQYPRKRAFPLQKYDIIAMFSHQGQLSATTIYGNALGSQTPAEISVANFNSDVNAAVRRDLALGVLPFRDVAYSEDQIMAHDATALRMWRAYAGRAVVEHSNDLTFHEYGLRTFDETVGLRRAGFDFYRLSLREILVATVRGSLGDTLRLLLDDDLSAAQRFRWLFANPWFHLRKWASMRAATRVDLNDHSTVNAGSLEQTRKRKATSEE